MAPRIESSDDSDADLPLGTAPERVNGKRKLSQTSPPAEKPSSGGPPSKRVKNGKDTPSPKDSKKSVKAPRPQKRKLVSSDASSDDDVPLARPAKQIVAMAIPPKQTSDVISANVPLAGDVAAAAASISLKTPKAAADDEDTPIQSGSKPKKEKPLPSKKTKKPTADYSDSGSEDVALVTKKATVKRVPKKKKVVKKESDDDDNAPKDEFGASSSKTKKEKAPPKKKAKTEPSVSPSKRKAKNEEEEEEEKFRWWEQDALGDGTQKWTTLEHQGVLFPPPYEKLPHDVKLYYDGKPIDLPPESEEVAGFFGAMLETDHAKDATFCKNFFNDFSSVLAEYPPSDGTKINSFDKCDFTKIAEFFEAERTRKKTVPAAEKKEMKAKKDEFEAKYTICLLDGRKEKMGNFRAEPPGLFRGRGEHPRKGALKTRLRPEDITINIGQNAPIPVPNIPGKWGKVIHDNTVTWLAHWKENINGNAKYVFLAAGSSLKGQSDMQKFEKARELKKHIAAVRKDYNENLKARVTADRQMATALYFIDRLALRAGNEKGEDEADTVGCCSLRYEHVTLQPPDKLVFDFLGKDSIRYYNVVDVEPQIYKNIRIFKGDDKGEGDAIFDRVTTSGINKHLTSYMKGLTAKVFRTYNASITFQQQLDERTPKDGSLIEKLAAYNEANRMVAILCNHQKSVSKNHGAAMDKLDNQIRAIKYQRRKLRYALFGLHKKYKKEPEYAEDESDIDDEWIAQYEDESREKEIEKAKKKFEKDNEKKAADGDDLLTEDVLDDRIEKINAEYDRLEKERGSEKAEVKGKKTEEQIIAAIEKIDIRIKTEKFKREDKEAGKEVSLGTSKINYLDPRITTAWCKKHDVPVDKMFSKTLMVKFPWAMEVEEDWKF